MRSQCLRAVQAAIGICPRLGDLTSQRLSLLLALHAVSCTFMTAHRWHLQCATPIVSARASYTRMISNLVTSPPLRLPISMSTTGNNARRSNRGACKQRSASHRSFGRTMRGAIGCAPLFRRMQMLPIRLHYKYPDTLVLNYLLVSQGSYSGLRALSLVWRFVVARSQMG